MLMAVYDRSLIKLRSDAHTVLYCCRLLRENVAFVVESLAVLRQDSITRAQGLRHKCAARQCNVAT